MIELFQRNSGRKCDKKVRGFFPPPRPLTRTCRTSTYTLMDVTLPYVLQPAKKGYGRAIRENATLAAGVNIHAGRVTNAAVAETFGLACAAV